jgi:hypothetical protein
VTVNAEAHAAAAAAVVPAVVGAALLALAAAALFVDSLGVVYVTGSTCNAVKITWSGALMYVDDPSDVVHDVAGVSVLLMLLQCVLSSAAHSGSELIQCYSATAVQ